MIKLCDSPHFLEDEVPSCIWNSKLLSIRYHSPNMILSIKNEHKLTLGNQNASYNTLEQKLTG